MMKVPRSVMSGKSPMKTSCSLISPVSLLTKRTSTKRGAWYEMSLARHSAMLLGASPNWWSPKVTSMVFAEFSMGENSAKDSARPSPIKRSNDSFCTEMRFGSSIALGILLKLMRSR